MKKGMLLAGIALLVYMNLAMVLAGGVLAQNANSVQGDRQALVDLYNATGGGNWDNNSGWLKGNPSNSWYGIQVDGNGRVVRLDLFSNNLNGNLPGSIGNLSRLTYLNTKQNRLSGEIPESINNLGSLEWLLLSGVRQKDPNFRNDTYPGKKNEATNSFSGSIPFIGNLSNLQVLEIANQPNFENTPIPAEIGNLKNLWFLSLQRNLHSGGVPKSFANLTNLRHLHLHYNKISEPLPEIFEGWTDAQYVRFGNNQIPGEIPSTFDNMINLRVLVLGKNNLTGSIPPKFLDGSLPRLHTVALEWNNLTGSIPPVKTNLTVLTLDGNNLSGTVPDMSSARKLINFGLGWNNFEGEFPDMSHARQLRYIRARNNNFSGPLPALHPNNRRLANLWFQNNNFSGPVDPSIAEAIANGRDSFGDFNISNNRFCESDLKGLVAAVNTMDNGVSSRYGGQSKPICGNNSSAKAQSLTGELVNGSESGTSANETAPETDTIPVETGINQNYPNPFNPTTQIEYTLSDVQTVSLKVYDMAGRQVAVLANGVKQAGRHTATFDAGTLASGVYFYRFITNSQVYTKKMTLLK
ncbi:T9SS C-terminal target domain-containing protein [Rhodohalobacter sp. SW132]|uniref:T9SS type A sorting domain-containing protein n=1 Tax=Rhodohalobacter sp. SW132 TaxID=2293433 RepID=UPI000E244509|nr:T9SS type A sorting domain-containing protein [Rhodohalobacter sp. SW132]REL23938.1 T9SS C-terminal target domain-containing protein [Rhodohalobacter sp. SW132]